MKTLTKQELNSIIAQVSEFGTGIIVAHKKEPLWIVRNVDGFIFAVERTGEYVVCTVLVPAYLLNRSFSELEQTMDKLNQEQSDRYGYAIKHILQFPLLAISAYYFREDFNVQRDILALDHHALHILSEI